MSLFRSQPRQADLALAALLAAFGLAELWIVHVGPKSIAVPATAVAGLALAFRRRAPLLTVAVVLGAIAAESLLGVSLQKPDAPLLMALVAVYTAGAYLPLRDAVAGLALAIAGIGASFAGSSTNGHSDVAFTSVVVTAGWLVGCGMHGRVTQTAALAERTQRLEREAEAERTAAIAEERRRIARDLHDVIAHSVSVMVVQAGAAEDLLDRDPAGAESRSARCRRPDAAHSWRSVACSDCCARTVPSSALPLSLDSTSCPSSSPRPRPPALLSTSGSRGRRALFRSASISPSIGSHRKRSPTRESTAAGVRAHVLLRYDDDTVELEVENDGDASTNGHRGGHGLIGMRERVAVFGGTLEAGPSPDGGFRVLARLPLRPVA